MAGPSMSSKALSGGIVDIRDIECPQDSHINATGAMDDICKQLNKQKPAICRMLGPSGNPTLESIVPVIRACADREKIKPVVCTDGCAA
jgi:hypothetical protein